MVVKELIECLSLEDPNKRVLVDGYENGYNELKTVRLVSIIPNKEKNWWDGEFENFSGEGEIALLLPRE